MTTRTFKSMTLAGLMSLAACNAVVPAQLPVLPPADSPSRVAAAVPASDALAMELFRDVVASEKGNVVFSPASAENLLRLLQRGATGKTRAAFDALPMGKTGVCSAMQVKSADGLFAESRVQVHLAGVPLQRVPFATNAEAAAKAVNDWCKAKTEGCIPELLRRDDISPDTALIALNAVYLREKWLRPFDPDATDKNADFLALRQIRRAKSGLVRCRRMKKEVHHPRNHGIMACDKNSDDSLQGMAHLRQLL